MSAVHQRVRRLEQRGLITGYRATLDATVLGLPLTAFVSITPIDVAQPDDAPAAPGPPQRHRGVPLGRGRGELHPQGAGRLAGRARAPAAGHPGGRRTSPRGRRSCSPPSTRTARRSDRVRAGLGATGGRRGSGRGRWGRRAGSSTAHRRAGRHWFRQRRPGDPHARRPAPVVLGGELPHLEPQRHATPGGSSAPAADTSQQPVAPRSRRRPGSGGPNSRYTASPSTAP